MSEELEAMRKSYEKYTLLEEETDLDPIVFFTKWFAIAKEENKEEANAMFLATVGKSGQPSGRVVLLKGIESGKFLFFTNYNSKKGIELSENPRAALTFFWASQERQIRIEGVISKTTKEESIDYFAKRPRVSQLGALVSNQSSVVPNRKYLEDKFSELEKKMQGTDIPMPEAWGGYALTPNLIEFWQGRQGRLHDRLQFVRTEDGWFRDRLSP